MGGQKTPPWITAGGFDNAEIWKAATDVVGVPGAKVEIGKAEIDRGWLLANEEQPRCGSFTILYSLFTIQALRLRSSRATPPRPSRAVELGSGTATVKVPLPLSMALIAPLKTVPKSPVTSVREL